MKKKTKKRQESVKKLFKPTKAMWDALRASLNPETSPTIVGVMRAAGLGDETWYTWIDRHGEDFLSWWDSEHTKGAHHWRWYLDKQGLAQLKSYPFWRVMQEKYGGYTEKLKQEHEVGETLAEIIKQELEEKNQNDGNRQSNKRRS